MQNSQIKFYVEIFYLKLKFIGTILFRLFFTNDICKLIVLHWEKLLYLDSVRYMCLLFIHSFYRYPL